MYDKLWKAGLDFDFYVDLKEDSPVYYWNLPFWDHPGLDVRYLWIFQVDHTFYELDLKILATSNEIRYVLSPGSPSSSRAVDPCQ